MLLVVVSVRAYPVYDHGDNHEQLAASSYDVGHFGFGSLGKSFGHGGYEKLNNAGAELASLAHNSAAQANQAVNNQASAGSQAAYGIKSSLATAAAEVCVVSVYDITYNYYFIFYFPSERM